MLFYMLTCGHQGAAPSDANQYSPGWQIDEDFVLLRTVQKLVAHDGSVNWELVASTLNANTSYTGLATHSPLDL